MKSKKISPWLLDIQIYSPAMHLDFTSGEMNQHVDFKCTVFETK